MRARAARLLVLGFEGLTLPQETRALLAAGAGGVILFRRNVQSAVQVQALIAACREAAPRPIWVGVDQEGGRVARLKGLTCNLPPMRALRTRQQAAEAGRLLGLELSSLGFNLDFAPVVDVDSNPDNPVIGDRAFSRDPAQVSAFATAFIEALQQEGVAACAKHFPGHGDSSQDSHLELPELPHGRARLSEVELPPFAAAARAGVFSMMTAHLRLPAVDPEWPATLSPTILAILREDLGYDGLLFSDDLEMAAVAERWPVETLALRSVLAGVDQLLICHSLDKQQRALQALTQALESGALSAERLADSERRIETALRLTQESAAATQGASPLSALGGEALQTQFASLLALAAQSENQDPTGNR